MPTTFTELDHDLLGDWLEGADHLSDLCGNYSLNIELGPPAPTSSNS